MSKNARNTQFVGYASKVRAEVFEKLDFLDFGFSSEQQASVERAIDLIIAQRAYDFAEHVIGEFCYAEDLEHRGCSMVADLTEWPEDEDAALEHYANHQYDGVDFGDEGDG